MIKKLEIAGQQLEVTPRLHTYVKNKIGKLDRYVSRHARESLHAEVKLKESKSKNQQQCKCTVIIRLPKETIEASETTVNIFAAVDIVEAKLRTQLKKYKETHESARLRRRFYERMRGRSLEA